MRNFNFKIMLSKNISVLTKRDFYLVKTRMFLDIIKYKTCYNKKLSQENETQIRKFLVITR